MLSTSDLKKGVIIEHDGAPCDVSFRGGETFVEPDFEKRPVQLLYTEKGTYHFMDSENYEQFGIHEDDLTWEKNFLKDELEGVLAMRCDEELLGIELPNSIALQIADTTPAIKGASVNARTKPATLETGLVVKVPEHIDQGEIIKVDSRTGDFIGRA